MTTVPSSELVPFDPNRATAHGKRDIAAPSAVITKGSLARLIATLARFLRNAAVELTTQAYNKRLSKFCNGCDPPPPSKPLAMPPHHSACAATSPSSPRPAATHTHTNTPGSSDGRQTKARRARHVTLNHVKTHSAHMTHHHKRRWSISREHTPSALDVRCCRAHFANHCHPYRQVFFPRRISSSIEVRPNCSECGASHAQDRKPSRCSLATTDAGDVVAAATTDARYHSA